MIAREKLEGHNIPDYIRPLSDHNDENGTGKSTEDNGNYGGKDNWVLHPASKPKPAQKIAGKRRASTRKGSLLAASQAVYRNTMALVPNKHGACNQKLDHFQTKKLRRRNDELDAHADKFPDPAGEDLE